MNEAIPKGHKSIYLIGDPVQHSVSPQIHNAAFQHAHLPYRYIVKQISRNQLPDFVNHVKTNNIIGFNVTIPLKMAIMDYLDEILPIAKEIRAVNTVKIKKGMLLGTNTDIYGVYHAFRQAEFPLTHHHKIILIGAGGVARAVAFYLSKLDDSNLYILNRTMSTAKELYSELINKPSTKANLYYDHLKTLSKYLAFADLIINATPVGMWPDTQTKIIGDYVPKASQWIFDLVYNPVETQLVKAAKKSGCKIINGLDMLIGQAKKAFKWWTGSNPDIKLMKRVAQECLR